MVICVIGAGAAGLTAIKQCLDQQLDVVCFEKTADIGGLWRFREENIDGVGCVSKNTIMKSSKDMIAFSDFVPPEDFPIFMPNKYVCNYFELYAKNFNLLPFIRLKHSVLNVTFNDDYEETGKWKVTVLNHKENKTFEQIFDGVMVCVGHHSKPHIPTFPGQEMFKGKILHFQSYKSSHGFEDKIAVVVGIGNSGADAAIELSSVCSQVYLATRSGAWILPLLRRNGMPVDVLFSRAGKMLLSLLPKRCVEYFLENIVNSLFNQKYCALRPKHSILAQSPTTCNYLGICVTNGRVLVRKNIKCFTENGVIFEGMKAETKCDIVLLATGYDFYFPFLDSSIIPMLDNKVRLFKNMFQPNLKHAHTLAMMNLVHPLGSFNPIFEIQSRWFALLMKGKCKLPKKPDMLRIVDEDIKRVEKTFYTSGRHTIMVDFLAYMDSIASYVGCKPNLLRYFFTDIKLWYRLMFGPLLSYQYRLNGPNTWNGARNAILTYDERFSATFKIESNKNMNIDSNILELKSNGSPQC